MGEEALGIVGRPGYPGNSVAHGSPTARLFRIQGTHLFIPEHSILCAMVDYANTRGTFDSMPSEMPHCLIISRKPGRIK